MDRADLRRLTQEGLDDQQVKVIQQDDVALGGEVPEERDNGNLRTAMPTTATPETAAQSPPGSERWRLRIHRSMMSCSAMMNATVWVRNSRPTIVAVYLVEVMLVLSFVYFADLIAAIAGTCQTVMATLPRACPSPT